MTKSRLVVLLTCLFSFPAVAQETAKSSNVVFEDSFENGDRLPRGWKSGARIPGVEDVYDKKAGSTGKRSLSLQKSVQRYFPIAQWFRTIPAPDSPAVSLSVKVRAKAVTKAIIEVQFLDGTGKFISKKWVSYIGAKKAGDKPVTHDWKTYSDIAEIPPKTKKLLIGLQIYGPGQVWFDDVKMTTAGPPAAAPDTSSSNATTIKVNNVSAQYIFEAPSTPNPSGNGLLIVLPGGDGSAGFHPFVSSIHKQSVGEDFGLAQPIAKKWSDAQQIVWPTSTNRVNGMKYSTEDLIAQVIADVGKQIKLDPQRIILLAWSSSGSAAYSTMLQEETAVSGAVLAMSVFKPNYLPNLKNAKNRRFYILHSQEDRICPYWMATNARTQLEENGAHVKMVDYKGGHGWHGDVFGDLSRGLKWAQATQL